MEWWIPVIWFAIIIGTAAIEAFTLDLVSLWFSAGAILALIASAWLGVEYQVAIFMITSFVLLLAIRPITKKYLQTNEVKTNVETLKGKIGKVTRAIEPGERGEVKVDGHYWSAICKENILIKEDEKVDILAVEGVKLIVKKIDKGDE